MKLEYLTYREHELKTNHLCRRSTSNHQYRNWTEMKRTLYDAVNAVLNKVLTGDQARDGLGVGSVRP